MIRGKRKQSNGRRKAKSDLRDIPASVEDWNVERKSLKKRRWGAARRRWIWKPLVMVPIYRVEAMRGRKATRLLLVHDNWIQQRETQQNTLSVTQWTQPSLFFFFPVKVFFFFFNYPWKYIVWPKSGVFFFGWGVKISIFFKNHQAKWNYRKVIWHLLSIRELKYNKT